MNKATKILIAEDEEGIREELVECLSDEGFECVEAANGEQGLDILRRDPDISIVLSDILMPGKTGLEMIEAARAEISEDRDIEFIIPTGHGGSREAINALRLGVMDFLEKPIDPNHLVDVVRRAEERIMAKRVDRNSKKFMEADLQVKAREIEKLYGDLEDAYGEALDCLAVAAEYKDPETGNHIHRIGAYAELMAKELGWSEKRQKLMLLAAPLHDAGKIGTPETILLKPEKLDNEEYAIMKEHSQNGYDILSNSKHSVMQTAADIAKSHHERWDGSGYPRGLKETEIPAEARITAIADVYDALRSERPYKPGFSHEEAVSIILDGDGRTDPAHFDPEILAIFKRVSKKFDEIYTRLTD